MFSKLCIGSIYHSKTSVSESCLCVVGLSFFWTGSPIGLLKKMLLGNPGRKTINKQVVSKGVYVC